MKERVAIIDGIRTPFCKSGGAIKDLEADDLGAYAVRELLARTKIDPNLVDEVIFGNVIQPPNSANIARILAIKGGLPIKTPAYTVNRNCASGMEAIVSGANRILLGEADIIIAGGTESMSNFPILISKKFKEFLMALSKAKNWKQKLGLFTTFRPSFLKPEFPGLNDPLCSLSMGQTAEILARDFKITRMEQDQFSLESHERASKALREGRFKDEIIPVPIPPSYDKMQEMDDGLRDNQTLEILGKLRTSFDPLTGSVTAGNASQITDGAAAILLMKESKAKELGLEPLGYITHSASAGLAPNRMGLGPVYAASKLFAQSGLSLKDFDLIEINEAFAAQVLAVVKAFASLDFAQKELGRDTPLGVIDMDKLNVNGGAVALGHPLGASGTRLILTLIKELRRRNLRRGLAALCIGGGQGEAVVVEVPA